MQTLELVAGDLVWWRVLLLGSAGKIASKRVGEFETVVRTSVESGLGPALGEPRHWTILQY